MKFQHSACLIPALLQTGMMILFAAWSCIPEAVLENAGLPQNYDIMPYLIPLTLLRRIHGGTASYGPVGLFRPIPLMQCLRVAAAYGLIRIDDLVLVVQCRCSAETFVPFGPGRLVLLMRYPLYLCSVMTPNSFALYIMASMDRPYCF